MNKSSDNLVKSCSIYMVFFGIYKLYPFGHLILRALEGQISINLSHSPPKPILFGGVIVYLFSFLLGASLIISGFGIYRFRKWARKLAILLLSIELLLRLQYTIFFPLEKSTFNIIEIIIVVPLCSLALYILLFANARWYGDQ